MTGVVGSYHPEQVGCCHVLLLGCREAAAVQEGNELRFSMDAELLKDATPEVLRMYWMRKREFDDELRVVVLTSETNIDDAWLEKWTAFTHPAVLLRTMESLSEFEHGLLKLTKERKDDPNFKSWHRQLSRVRAANQKAKDMAGYFDPAPGGLGLTRRRSVKQNFSILAELIARNERALVKVVRGIEEWHRACLEDEIELGDHDLALLALLDENVASEDEDPVSVREAAERVKGGVRRL